MGGVASPASAGCSLHRRQQGPGSRVTGGEDGRPDGGSRHGGRGGGAPEAPMRGWARHPEGLPPPASFVCSCTWKSNTRPGGRGTTHVLSPVCGPLVRPRRGLPRLHQCRLRGLWTPGSPYPDRADNSPQGLGRQRGWAGPPAPPQGTELVAKETVLAIRGRWHAAGWWTEAQAVSAPRATRGRRSAGAGRDAGTAGASEDREEQTGEAAVEMEEPVSEPRGPSPQALCGRGSRHRRGRRGKGQLREGLRTCRTDAGGSEWTEGWARQAPQRPVLSLPQQAAGKGLPRGWRVHGRPVTLRLQWTPGPPRVPARAGAWGL